MNSKNKVTLHYSWLTFVIILVIVSIISVLAINRISNSLPIPLESKLEQSLRLNAKASLKIADELNAGILSPVRIELFIKGTDFLLDGLRETLREMEKTERHKTNNQGRDENET